MNTTFLRRTPKVATVVAALALTTAGLAGCSSSGASEANGVTTLTFWSRATTAEPVSAPLVEAFNATHKNIQVKLTSVPDAQYVSKFGATARAGSAPDLVSFDDINAPVFAASGLLTDLSSFVSDLPSASTLSPGQRALATYRGKTYAAPYSGGASVMYYNKDLFSQAGLDPDSPPTDWAQLSSDVKAISALGGDVSGITLPGACPGCLEFTLLPLVWASGGNVLTAAGDNQTTTFAKSQPVADMLAMYQGFWQDGDIPKTDRTEDGTTWGQNFLKGQVGIHFGPIQLSTSAKSSGMDYGVAPIPGQDGSYATFAGGDVMGIPAASKHQQQAETFITWMLQSKQQAAIVDGGFTPGQLSTADADFQQQHPDLAVAVKALKKGRAPQSLATSAVFNDANGPWLGAVDQVVFSGSAPETALSAADATSNKLLSQANDQLGR